MAGIVLRAAAEGDVPRLVAIARRSWLSAFAAHAPPAFVEHWRAADRAPSWYAEHWPDMIVAEAAGAPVGLTQPAADEVNGLWVDPDWQGRGVGTTLLRAAEERILAQGHRRPWLTCSGFNPRAAAFYQARGYVVERRERRTHASGATEELLIFVRREP
jgi:GNAT superfamily N-acetyltransferase